MPPEEPQESLLRAVRGSPDDDGPRLVCADWLEEHDRPEHAELIRVQCEVVRCRPSRRTVLRAREKELLALPALRWERSPVRYERGFLEGVPLEVGEFAAEAEALHRLGTVLSIHLYFEGTERLNRHLPALAAAPLLERVTRLSGMEGEVDQEGVRSLFTSPYFRNVEEIELFQAEIGPDGLAALLEGPSAGRLRRLQLNGCIVRDAWRATPEGEAAGRLLAACPRLAALEELHLVLEGVGDEGALALAASPHLAGLRLLDLGGNRFGPAAVEALRQRFGPRVYCDVQAT